MKITLLLSTLLLLPLTGLAQTPIQPDGQRREIFGGRSEGNRLDKRYMVTAQANAVGPSLVSNGGVQGGIFLDHNSLLLLELTNGAGGAFLNGLFGSEYTYRASSVGVHYKRFVANSFYVRAGGDYRVATFDYKYTSVFGGTYRSDYHFEGNSLAANFQIGNQWQFSGFTIGCDWVGYSLPVVSNVTNERMSANSTDTDRKNMQEDQDRFLKQGHLNLLRFYLGASF